MPPTMLYLYERNSLSGKAHRKPQILSMMVEKQEIQGAPQTVDEGYHTIVEVTDEEQHRITALCTHPKNSLLG